MIVIIDYGMGNVGSIRNMLRKAGFDSLVSSKIQDIEEATKIILPGVGAFDNGIDNLEAGGLIPIIKKKVLKDHTPLLGICLGMQLLTKKSDEGNLPGLALIDGVTKKFNFPPEEKLKIPHMGWNTIQLKKESILCNELDQTSRFYFVHSYYVQCADQNDVLAETDYGGLFCSALQKENIFGVQFHPEKSHHYGMRLLRNFAR